jgi:hypothetical protein
VWGGRGAVIMKPIDQRSELIMAGRLHLQGHGQGRLLSHRLPLLSRAPQKRHTKEQGIGIGSGNMKTVLRGVRLWERRKELFLCYLAPDDGGHRSRYSPEASVPVGTLRRVVPR